MGAVSSASISALPCSRAPRAAAHRRWCRSSYGKWTLRTSISRRPASDAAVATFLFCVLADNQQEQALRELQRVVRPGGTIRLLKYVRPRSRLRRLSVAMWEPWVAWAYGASFDRNTAAHIFAAGLELLEARF